VEGCEVRVEWRKVRDDNESRVRMLMTIIMGLHHLRMREMLRG